MNIALLGYGNMGKETEAVATERGHTITAVIDRSSEKATHKKVTAKAVASADTVIDFTQPESVLENIRIVTAAGKNMVVGTTGWYGKESEARKIVAAADTGFLYASNFSIGVNVFFAIVEEAARKFNRLPQYDVFGYEMHHNQKKDSPSGTAVTLGNILLENIERKTAVETNRVDGKIRPEQLHFASIRSGSIPGTHVVGFDSAADTIELRHTARSRRGFAEGAVMAAEWLQGKRGFLTMKDFMQDYFSE